MSSPPSAVSGEGQVEQGHRGRLVRRAFALIVALAFGGALPAELRAQGEGAGGGHETMMQVRAEVVRSMGVHSREMNFGRVVAGSSQRVKLDEEGAGVLHVTGDPRFNIRLTVADVPAALEHVDARSGSLATTYRYCVVAGGTESAARASCRGTGRELPLVPGVEVIVGGDDGAWMLIGGWVESPRNQALGHYVGTLRLLAMYDGF